MIQATRVLPSNAPPLNADDSYTSRVLQEHSLNPQDNEYSCVTSLEQQHPSSLFMENSYPGYQPAYQPQHVYRQTPLQRHHYRHGRPGQCGIHSDPARNEKIARHLYLRFRASDQYMKYRERQHKDPKTSEQKWPERLESAFFQALVQWPPMGRRQVLHKGKQRGRNELIADYIEELTGESRTRKQVSSHIQVLKPFVDHDSFIMKWLAQDLTKADQTRFYGRHSSYFDEPRASEYAVITQGAQVPNPILSSPTAYDLLKVKNFLDVFEPIDFSMFVQRKHKRSGGECIERLHTYTSSITQPLQPEQRVSSWQSFQQHFPLLHSLHHRRPLACNVLLAEASLGFPDTNFRDEDGVAVPNIELGISFLCSSNYLPVHVALKCHNTFWKDDHLLDGGTTDVRLAQSEGCGAVETQLKFGSTFWAKTFASIATKLNNDADSKKAREYVTHHLKGITAIQEIFIMTESNPERLLVIHWKFRLSKIKQGRTYWRRVLLPYSHGYAELKTERVDSFHDCSLSYNDTYPPQPQIFSAQPLLQPPLAYYSSSASASAFTSGSWPASLDDVALQHPTAWSSTADDNTFDFTYDPNLGFSAFDSSAFDFDATADFATDPALQDYSQNISHAETATHEYAQQGDYSWCVGNYSADAGAKEFDAHEQQSEGGGYSMIMTPTGSTDGPVEGLVDTYRGVEPEPYGVGFVEGQVYGGARQEIGKEEEDSFATLGSARCVTQVPQQEMGYEQERKREQGQQLGHEQEQVQVQEMEQAHKQVQEQVQEQEQARVQEQVQKQVQVQEMEHAMEQEQNQVQVQVHEQEQEPVQEQQEQQEQEQEQQGQEQQEQEQQQAQAQEMDLAMNE